MIEITEERSRTREPEPEEIAILGALTYFALKYGKNGVLSFSAEEYRKVITKYSAGFPKLRDGFPKWELDTRVIISDKGFSVIVGVVAPTDTQ